MRRVNILLSLCVLLFGFSAAALAGGAKNVILLIGDGMGPSQVGTTLLYSTNVLGRDLRMVELMKAGRTAYMLNDTADATVTESAAAAGQMATGKRMIAKTISMEADGKTPVKTLLEIAQEKNKAVGLVTTSGITDATPAAFASHLASRSDEASAAEQLLAHRVDVLMGGRKQFFLPESAGGKRKDGRDLIAEARNNGYQYASDAKEMDAANGNRLLGLFNKANMTYEIDRAQTKEPSLAQMTVKALKILSARPEGFFAMVEGGRIDHAAHRNDAAAVIHDTLAFDEAIGVAIDFAKKTPGTLVIVTADHETGGMGVLGHSKTSKEYAGINLKALERVNASFDVMIDEMMPAKSADKQYMETTQKTAAKLSPEKVKEVVKKYMSIELTDDEAQTVSSDTLRTLDPYNNGTDFVHSLAFVLRPYLRVAFLSKTHTATPLYLFGAGPGAERINGMMHNTEVFGLIRDAMETDSAAKKVARPTAPRSGSKGK